MAVDMRMALVELLCKAEMEHDADFRRDGVRALMQRLMDIEVTQHLHAEPHERTLERTGQRNGYANANARRSQTAAAKDFAINAELEVPPEWVFEDEHSLTRLQRAEHERFGHSCKGGDIPFGAADQPFGSRPVSVGPV